MYQTTHKNMDTSLLDLFTTIYIHLSLPQGIIITNFLSHAATVTADTTFYPVELWTIGINYPLTLSVPIHLILLRTYLDYFVP